MHKYSSPPPPLGKKSWNQNESTRQDTQQHAQRSQHTIFSPNHNLASPEPQLNQSKIIHLINETKTKFNSLAPPFPVPLPDLPLDSLPDDKDKQMSFVLKRLFAMEKEMGRRQNEETLLEMQQDLLRVKNAQLEQHNVLTDNIQQSEVMQQLMVVQDRLSALE